MAALYNHRYRRGRASQYTAENVAVITSYSIHYTKLYDDRARLEALAVLAELLPDAGALGEHPEVGVRRGGRAGTAVAGLLRPRRRNNFV